MRNLLVVAAGAVVSAFAVGPVPAVASELSVGQILEKNAVARGGLDAWQKVDTMVVVGHIESANASAAGRQFVLETKRPNKTRFEVRIQNQQAVRVYDGTRGWKLRPVQGGRTELQPYSAEELKFARDGEGTERPLLDLGVSAGNATLEGIDEVEGHKAYRLAVRLLSGTSHHVWIDTESFLECKYDRESRNAFGQSGVVSVFYRDYRKTNGLQMPFLIETGAGAGTATDRMVIDKVLVNQPLDDKAFSKPGTPVRRDMASVTIEAPPPAGNAFRAAPVVPPRRAVLPPTREPGGGGAQ